MRAASNLFIRSIKAGTALALFGLGGFIGQPMWTGEAEAATQASLIGEVEYLTVNGTDKWAGGEMIVGGQRIIIPRNLLMDLPANRLTLRELFDQATPACKAVGQTGLAKFDTCNVYKTGAHASISANRTNAPTGPGNVIAGDILIEKGTEAISGAVTYINYSEGYFRIGGTPGNAENGVMVRLNDPDSRHTIQSGAGCINDPVNHPNCSPDPRFTLDPDNYTNSFSTGFPLCIPSRTPRTFIDRLDLNINNNTTEELANPGAGVDGTGDMLCPTTNRTINGGLPVDDSRRLAPIMLGDNVVVDGNWEIINNVRFLSAHSTMVSAALLTKNQPDQPDYMFLNEVEVDVAGFNNQRARTLIIGFVTKATPAADVLIWSLHYDPQTNQPHEFPLASVVGCEIAAGLGECAAQGLGGVAGNNIFKIRHDVDFLVGADPKSNPCAHLIADARMRGGSNRNIVPCNNNAGGLNIGEMLGILSPISREIQARTGHKLANPGMITIDINGNEATNGQYLFPFGMNLGGVSTPEFDEIDLNAMHTPMSFSGIPWMMDRRLSPGGCDGPCEGTVQPLTPFPFEQLNPRTQAQLPLGPYTDRVYTATDLTDVRDRVLSYTLDNGRPNGNATVLAWPPVNPAVVAIAPTPLPGVAGGGGGNLAPSIVVDLSQSATATAGVLFTYDVHHTDPNAGDVIQYSLTGTAPAGMTIDQASGVISWTPIAAQAPSQTINVRATDQGGLFDDQAFAITVNAPPVITSSPVLTARETVPYSYQVTVTDPNGNGGPFTYSLTASPADMTISASGLISWTPAAQGAPTVTVRVTDATGLFVEQTYVVTVLSNAPVAPVFSPTTNGTAAELVLFTKTVAATDANGDAITYSLVTAPAAMTINPTTGLISWTPTLADAGTPVRTVTVRATDNSAQLLSSTQTFTVTVENNVGPAITQPVTPPAGVTIVNGVWQLQRNVAYTFNLLATDPQAPLTWFPRLVNGNNNNPANLQLGAATGVVTWTPTNAQANTNFTLRFRVQDATNQNTNYLNIAVRVN
jgi:Putative Ig domain